MTSYIQDFIKEVEGSNLGDSERGTRASRPGAEPDPFPSTRGTRSTRPRTQPTQTLFDDGLMPGDTFVGYDGITRLTLDDLVAMGVLEALPTSREWKVMRPFVVAELKGGTRRSGKSQLGEPGEDTPTYFDDYLGPSTSSGGGGGGGGRSGGGAAGPVYVNPDRAQVEDYVKSYVVATTGKAHKDLIESGVAAFLATDRQGFDSEDQAYDPATAMKNTIRSSDKYKAVHQRRPESVDEMDWVGSRQGQLRQLGLSASLAEEVGIETSIAGASGEAVQGAGEVAQVGATGRLLDEQRERLKSKAIAAARLM